MLPKSKRLNLKKDFKFVASGKKLESKFLKLFIKLSGNKETKIGVAVSSKNFKKANQRNRAKRLVSYAFEKIYSKLPAATNVVALPKAGIIDVKSDDVLLDLERTLIDEKIIS